MFRAFLAATDPISTMT